MSELVLGVDIGGTGVRIRLSRLDGTDPRTIAERERRVPMRIDGAYLGSVLPELLRPALAAAHRRPDVAAIGCTGAALLGEPLRRQVATAVAETSGTRQVVLCSDLLTGYLGALGLRAGAVLAAGTGAVALGTDLNGTSRRVDGWGHLLGDDGGGAWIGRAGMRAALRAVDGRPGGSAGLLATLRDRHGDPVPLVAELTGRTDRAGMFAGFAPDVIAAATDDPVASDIVHRAAGHLADTLLAALPEAAVPLGAVTGNLLRPDTPLTSAFTRAVRARAGELLLRPSAGTPLDGTIILAAAVRRGPLPADLAQAAALSILHTSAISAPLR